MTIAPERSLLTLPSLDDAARAALFTQARTTNTFTDEPVTPDQLREIYDLAKWGPTAVNSQPMRVAWVTTPGAHDRLVPLMNPGNQAKTAQAPVVALVAADIDWHDHLGLTAPHIEDAASRFADEDARAATATMNAAIQLGYFLLAVRAVGLSAGPMGGFDHEAAAREFFPGGRQSVLAAVNIGHAGPDAHYPRRPRLPFDVATTTY